MWFFKKKPAPDLPAHAILDQLKEVYRLERKTPSESSIMGDWWESRLDGRRLAFQERGRGLAAFLGVIEEITEIYLCRNLPGQPVPVAARQHLARIVGAEGAALASQFFLGAHPDGDFDYPALRLPPLRDGTARLSPSIREIAVYESFRGLSLITDETATPTAIAGDLQLAAGMLDALAAMAGR